MNLAIVPFHDWRKILVEGNRTRDAHFIEYFREADAINKLIIINRPITCAELLIKKKIKRIPGEVVLSNKGCCLIRIDEKTFVIDFISSQFIQHIIQKRDWYLTAFCDNEFVRFIRQCLGFLSIKDINYLSHNIYASYLFKAINPSLLIFDAYDNVVKFPFPKKHLCKLSLAYSEYKNTANMWITNSQSNLDYYQDHYHANNIKIIRNGIESSDFKNLSNNTPSDIVNINKPIVGFGGKITHLFDYDLYNYLLNEHPDKSFVIVGQIINREVYGKIKKRSNFHYLGDKNYSDYPYYVKSFDFCIIPYLTNDCSHGGDSIKAYEYLTTGKKTIGTIGNGLETLGSFLYLCSSYKNFSKEISNTTNNKKIFNDKEFSWKNKGEKIIELFNSL
jgi:teichuronic acid biosynthesis glycosyltransferase TuaH